MAFPGLPVNGVVEVAALGTWNEQSEIANVYQLQNIGANISVEANLIDDLIEFVEAVYAIVQGLYGVQMVWDRLRARFQGNQWVTGDVPLDTPIVGTQIDGAGIPGTAALLYMNTGVARVQLRKYLGPISQNLVITTTGELDSGAVAAAVTLGAYLLGDIVLTNGTYRYGYSPGPALTFNAPIEGLVSQEVAYQRRRKPGVGV